MGHCWSRAHRRWEIGRAITAWSSAVLFHIRTGVPWPDLPERYGSWKTIYEQHRRWSADCTCDRIMRAVQADADLAGRIDWSMVGVGSRSCRAHQRAAGTARAGRGFRNWTTPRRHRSDEGIRRPQGGLTCKIHRAREGSCRPVFLLVAPGQ